MKKIVIVLMVLLVGCSEAKTETDINMVRSGVLHGYETTTIGKAFEASFFAWEWTEFEDDKGRRIVEFNGKLTTAIHDAFKAWAIENLSGPELFELASAYGHQLPPELDDLNRLPEAIDWALETVWQDGTDFTAQFAILVNPGIMGRTRFDIVGMEVAFKPMTDHGLMLSWIYQ